MDFQISFAVGGDHAGFDYKDQLIDYLKSLDIQVQDFGTYSADSVDYPDFAHPVAESVEKANIILACYCAGVLMAWPLRLINIKESEQDWHGIQKWPN